MIMERFLPESMYWLADDGRAYSGPKQQPVENTDEDYLAYVSEGRIVRPWPRDIDGNQTTSALQDVLTPYGMFADLAGYAADVRWRKEVGGIVVGGVPVATDDRSKLLIAGARIKADAKPEFTTKFKAADGSRILIGAATVIAISDAVADHVDSCFETEDAVLAAIDAGTITTREHIDVAFAE
jgi:hypothetical protein